MLEIIIDAEFRDYLGALDKAERAALAELIRSDGCRDPLVVWRQPDGSNVLIDGHNRHSICCELGLPYRIVDAPSWVTDRDSAKHWIAINQSARRNQTPNQARYYAGRAYISIKQRPGGSGNNQHKSVKAEIGRSAKILAKRLGISERNLYRHATYTATVDKIAERYGQEVKRLILLGVKSVEDYDLNIIEETVKKPHKAKMTTAAKTITSISVKAKNKTNAFANGELWLGDCLDLMNNIEDCSIDFILCDLPYGTTYCPWDTILPFEELWQQYNRILKANGAIALFGRDPFSSQLRVSNIKDYRYDWIWIKDKSANWQQANKQPLYITENISMFYRRQPTYNPQKRQNPTGANVTHVSSKPHHVSEHVHQILGKANIRLKRRCDYVGKNYEPDKLMPNNVLRFQRPQRDRLHPTQKPLDLCEYLIRTYTNENELVLDNCMGSGTTCHAAHNAGRRFIGIEKEQEYYRLAVQRIHDAENAL